MSPQTIKWWMAQNPEVTQECWANPNERDLQDVLLDLNLWFSGLEGLILWANPPSFDITIIETAMRRLDIEPTWSHRRLMDLRTIRILTWGNERREEEWEGTAILKDKTQHNALDDAIRQCAMVQQCLVRLKIEAP